jgi:hypothetical protein
MRSVRMCQLELRPLVLLAVREHTTMRTGRRRRAPASDAGRALGVTRRGRLT